MFLWRTVCVCVCVSLPVTEHRSKRSFRILPIESTFPLCQKLRLFSQAQSRGNPNLAEARTLLESCVQVCRQSRIHSKGKTHTRCSNRTYSCSFMFLQQTGFLRHTVVVSSCLSSSIPRTLWKLPFGKRAPYSLWDSSNPPVSVAWWELASFYFVWSFT